MHHLSPLAIDRMSFLHEKSILAPTFYSLLHQMPFSRVLSVVNVDSILSLSQMAITSISCKQLHLEQEFVSVSSLADVSLNTSNQDHHEKIIQMTLSLAIWCIER